MLALRGRNEMVKEFAEFFGVKFESKPDPANNFREFVRRYNAMKKQQG